MKIKNAIQEIHLLLDYAKIFACTPNKVQFDPSLARGLDYYTGVIFEVLIRGIYSLQKKDEFSLIYVEGSC